MEYTFTVKSAFGFPPHVQETPKINTVPGLYDCTIIGWIGSNVAWYGYYACPTNDKLKPTWAYTVKLAALIFPITQSKGVVKSG